jgi:phosphatidylinositol transfer protein SFH5
MEKSITRLDFTELEDMVQVHGKTDVSSPFSKRPLHIYIIDYEGVGLRNRDANSKNAAAEATNIFQSHYPEFLVSNHSLPSTYH